ncbi:hypothetical protein [Marinobacter sp. ELB17]|uniref:hypothetical protein n=1 Tax=Marinobacter sp. ELB17 TaxID=270374 RepID=UPI0000F3A7FA|nr:hypothetical protein [Marinobacter sp. ELB17]EAZ98217.1 hypothetical protein MELB17_08266 [Marinobacter sp. ELB17]
MRFEIDWLAHQHKSVGSEELLTRCRMALQFRSHPLFRHENQLGEHQVRDAINVSAYPLALWFAANWWRLRWEPGFNPNDGRELHDWEMTHHLAAAGEGYAWPDLTFASDGESIQAGLKPSRGNTGPVRYIERLDAWVPANEYEAAVDQLVNQTLERLSNSKEHTHLHELWQTVCEERKTPTIALQRQLEARLGYDSEEAPGSLLALLTDLIAAHGEGAVQELACLGRDRTEKTIESVEACLSGTADSLKLPLKSVRRTVELLSDGNPSQPWEKGHDAANTVRSQLGVDKGPLNNRKLAELLETPPQFLEHSQTAQRLPIGIGEVADNGRAKVALGKKRKDARRFMTARLIADGIYAGETGNWLPCTDATTVRQKFQRAFAQEFLCPYNDLVEWMDTTSPDEELMEVAAEHFEVSPLLINTVMVNHGHIPRSELEAFQQAV